MSSDDERDELDKAAMTDLVVRATGDDLLAADWGLIMGICDALALHRQE